MQQTTPANADVEALIADSFAHLRELIPAAIRADRIHLNNLLNRLAAGFVGLLHGGPFKLNAYRRQARALFIQLETEFAAFTALVESQQPHMTTGIPLMDLAGTWREIQSSLDEVAAEMAALGAVPEWAGGGLASYQAGMAPHPEALEALREASHVLAQGLSDSGASQELLCARIGQTLVAFESAAELGVRQARRSRLEFAVATAACLTALHEAGPTLSELIANRSWGEQVGQIGKAMSTMADATLPGGFPRLDGGTRTDVDPLPSVADIVDRAVGIVQPPTIEIDVQRQATVRP